MDIKTKILNTKPAGPDREALNASLERHFKNIFLNVTGKLPTGDWPSNPAPNFMGLPQNISNADLNTAVNQAGGWAFIKGGLERGVGPAVMPSNPADEQRTRSTRMGDFKSRISAALTRYSIWPLPMTTPDERKYLELTNKIAALMKGDLQGSTPASNSTTPASGNVFGPIASSAPAKLQSQKVAGVPGNDVWGPPYVGIDNSPRKDMGNSSSGIYPYLFGPYQEPPPPAPAPPAPPAPPADTVPTSGMLGSDAFSRFFGASRVPGDKDMIPDPYAFTPSTSSSKTEPIPFLTNFSAFAK